MSNFGLTDIVFNQVKSTISGGVSGMMDKVSGPLAKLYAGSDSSDMLKYPLDIGSASRGHYVVFYANKFFNSQYSNIKETGGLTQAQANLMTLSAQRGVGTAGGALATSITNVIGAPAAGAGMVAKAASSIGLDKVASMATSAQDSLKTITSGFSKAGESFAENLQSSSNKYKRTNQSIALYMPGVGINMDYQHSYNEVGFTEAMGTAGMIGQAGVSSYDALVDAAKSGSGKSLKNLTPFVTDIASSLVGKARGAGAGQILFQATGYATNPQVELLYQSPRLREQQFVFEFYPTSLAEAKEIFYIIKRFKFHAAPEIAKGTSGRYFIPPSSFDIRFFYNGEENKNIAKITTCVLSNIQVNYSPDGAWVAYESDAGGKGGIGDGFPKHITLQLSFQEMEIISKELIDISGQEEGF